MIGLVTQFVEAYYLRWKVKHPADISLWLWNKIVDARVTYRPGPPLSFFLDDTLSIGCDGHMPLQLRRVVIAHEIGHALLDGGMHEGMRHVYRGKQERIADTFSMESLMPTYMLRNLFQSMCPDRGYAEQEIAELFGVPLPFAARRLDALFCHHRGLYHSPASEFEYIMKDPIQQDWCYQMTGTEVVGTCKWKPEESTLDAKKKGSNRSGHYLKTPK